jgi:hypothetical protein
MSEHGSIETAYFLVMALGSHCALDADKIIELLTGWAWDEEEASRVKRVGG